MDSVLRADYNDVAKHYGVGYKFQGSYFASVFRVSQGTSFRPTFCWTMLP